MAFVFVVVFVDLSFCREFENVKLQKWVETHGQKCSRRTRIENFDRVFLVYNAYIVQTSPDSL